VARSNAVGKLRQIVEEQLDPKQALLKALGKELNSVDVLGCRVLVAVYTGGKHHAGTSILRIDTDLLEQKYQCPVGLVVSMGPGAFVDAPGAAFHGVEAKVGDWVFFRPSDGQSTQINQVSCRVFEDVNILMVVNDPSLYW
jgi:co-chaperonin GroES (HSP10)